MLACPRARALEYFGMSLQDSSRSEATPPASGEVFYRYRDASGRIVIVDSLARVPAAERSSARAIELEPASGWSESWLARDLHWPSFIAGASSVGLTRKLGRVLRAALVLGAVALGVLAYFGWVRRTAGQSSDLLASPGALVEDARARAEQLTQRNREQQRLLKELENVR